MSEIGLNINVDSYNNEGIKTIKGNNNAEIYKLYILKNKRRLSLVGKTVKLGYVMAGTTKGDIIEDLNITNAEQGEITLPITNRISKKDGVYSCQLAIYGEDEFLEYTATFGLTVEANIFTKIAGEIENSKNLTYIERILEEATNISEELRSNIPVARQLNSDLENQNRILNENIDRSNGVNNTLITTTEQSKVAATDAIEKKGQLEKSITKAKEFIDGLDGSQNIPGIRMELTELQNGLKSNQVLSYEGSSIVANETLEGRTEGMRIKGRSLLNLIKDGKGTFVIDKNKNQDMRIYTFKLNHNLVRGKKYVGYIQVNSMENVTSGLRIYGWSSKTGVNGGYFTCANNVGVVKFKWNTSVFPENVGEIDNLYLYVEGNEFNNGAKLTFSNFMLFEEGTDLTYIDEYFEGLKSFGEAEKEGDKYKISILSHSENLFNYKTMYSTDWVTGDGKIINSGDGKYYSIKVPIFKTGVKYYIKSDVLNRNVIAFLDENNKILKAEVVSLKNPIETPTTPYGTKYILAYLNANGYDNDISNGIVVSLDKTISYASYKDPNKKDILIKEPLKEREYIYEDNGQVKVYRPTKQYTFTGNETSIIKWATVKDENFIGFCITNDDIPNLTSKRSLVVCNNFPSVDGVITKRNMYIAANSVNICIEKSALATPDIEGFRAWLKANPTTIVYQLAEPTVEIVENCVDIDLDTYQEKTYFNILNSIPGSLDFKVPSNIGSLVQSNAKEINNINEFINNFILKALLEMNKDLAAIKIKNGLN
ncbi:BppU family phage baseplate upper protein [Clostridium perfringens]|uniref:BppU family phage baseplate upper protein n=1 Tax=Clostridium perfringens TaxID=1502 RepID=UPI001D46CA0A|nr:BppU family phage baseplate upper protein [Clostridium perfringens]ELC8461930.1 BppU family phage baseplate upper protein [Clostridium perfringens]